MHIAPSVTLSDVPAPTSGGRSVAPTRSGAVAPHGSGHTPVIPRSAAAVLPDAVAGGAIVSESSAGRLPTVGAVDLARYAGTWYELARMPTWFQSKRSVSTATYTARPDGKVTVDNASFIGDRQASRIRGTASPVDGSGNARLKVGFGGLFRLIPKPKEGNYWVLDLQPDYSMALVGSPDRTSLWLLSRDPMAWDTAVAQRMVARATELGFDTDRLLVADWATRTMRP